MLDANIIYQVLRDRGVNLSGEIVASPGMSRSFFIPIRLTRGDGSRQEPSGRVLAEIRSILSGHEIDVQYILRYPEHELVEESVRASLLSTFPSLIRNSYCSIDREVNVWIDLKRFPSEAESEKVSSHVKSMVLLYALPEPIVYLLSEASLPTKTELLSAIRQIAPVGCEELKQRLLQLEYDVPSLDWINR